MIKGISIYDIITVSTLMFFIGAYGFISRKNLITMLMAIELMLNAVNINFVAFNKYLHPQNMEGHFYALFIIAIAAAEAAVAIAIIINLYRNLNSIDVEDVNNMKH
ncbi:MAG: NADH-quinone oxidoreductase subunit NuoK [Bacteroidetes bacterium]|jgi:NADH:ubiquinone oxidoreductase subunit K|nr:MAG: NADH-quinone oxidoreductase subunit K [Cryomorphaceae bacterium BACL11 MAG-121001-bin54]KRO65670.1 MAG: NADH-quinone oxidoreductase subunit K [Cryomorphaceae bacterium BACL11 MAG-121015-bin20]KRO70844.1 MAG: NADH-quinone oxidoreductase subunit K [Cryomorphaceae bacterium BACL11 MAG-121128-bin16]MBC8474529.1 NADH-quinone oxidoreductase subunit NuoK [Cryomorphaceae bacterium]MDA0682314.1 NADH-quinone oxidoreductase subunit NuoK [Bacteroidota bacterium]